VATKTLLQKLEVITKKNICFFLLIPLRQKNNQ